MQEAFASPISWSKILVRHSTSPGLKASDSINRGSANVYPAEMERVLREESGVHDCAVAGRADAPLGHTVASPISLDPEQHAQQHSRQFVGWALERTRPAGASRAISLQLSACRDVNLRLRRVRTLATSRLNAIEPFDPTDGP
jgi:acyl-CoA synthetase (AMP-forming)/AMP-acid ligase II